MGAAIMTRLRIFPSTSGEEFDWILLDKEGRIVREGCDGMPEAEACDVIVPAAKVLLTRAMLPKGNRKRLTELVPFAIEENVIAEPEMNHVAIGPILSDGYTSLAVVDKAWLRAMLARLGSAGANPERVVPETLLPVLQPRSWALVWNGSGGFLRTGTLSGLALDGCGDQPPQGLVLALREAADDPPQRILLHVSEENLPDIAGWRTTLGVEIVREVAWDWKTASIECPLELLQGEFGSSRINLDWLPKLRPALVMLLAMVVFQFTGIVADWIRLAQEKKQLALEMNHIFRESFPGSQVVVDAALQMARKLAEIRHAEGYGEADDFISLLGRVSPLLSQLPRKSLRSIDYGSGKLGLQLAFSDPEFVRSMAKNLQAAGLKVEPGKVVPGGGETMAYFTVSPGGK